MIHLLSQFSSETLRQWTMLGIKEGWLDETDKIRTWVELEFVTTLYFRLRRTDFASNAACFPHGKDLVLGLLEDLIEKALNDESSI